LTLPVQGWWFIKIEFFFPGYRPYDSGVDDAMEFPYQRHGEVEAEEHVITVTINSEVQNLTSNGVRAGRKKEVTFRVQGQELRYRVDFATLNADSEIQAGTDEDVMQRRNGIEGAPGAQIRTSHMHPFLRHARLNAR